MWDAYVLGSSTLNITVIVHGNLSSLNLINDTESSLMQSGGTYCNNRFLYYCIVYSYNVKMIIAYCNRYLIQNSPAVKKVCGPKKAIVKEDVKSKMVAKKWL